MVGHPLWVAFKVPEEHGKGIDVLFWPHSLFNVVKKRDAGLEKFTER